MIRYFKTGSDIYAVLENQYTQDEKQALIESADTPQQLAVANAITACAPAGAIELTGHDLEDILSPSKNFDQELEELNIDYQSKLAPLVAEANLAIARNTDNQTSKLAAAQAKIADLDAWYAAEQDLLIIKYF